MKHNEFLEKIKDIPNLQYEGERRSGGVLGLYTVFAKWKHEEDWIFVRAYETVKGLIYMLSTIPKDVYIVQDYKILYVTGNENEYVKELLKVESTNDDAT